MKLLLAALSMIAFTQNKNSLYSAYKKCLERCIESYNYDLPKCTPPCCSSNRTSVEAEKAACEQECLDTLNESKVLPK